MRRPSDSPGGSNTQDRESSLPAALQRSSPLRPFAPLTASQAQEMEAEQRDAGEAGGTRRSAKSGRASPIRARC